MGKLYDRRDMEFDLGVIDRLEQETSQQILAGTLSALKSKLIIDLFDKERQKCKMQLLRTSQLVADLRSALALFRACPHCVTNAAGKQRPCDAHKAILGRAKRAVKFAADENLARRAANGQMRPGDEVFHDGAPNRWEAWYWADRKVGVWPGTHAWTGTQSDLDKMREQYDSLDYRGWLKMLLQEEEISYPEYCLEMERLRGAQP